MALIKKKLSFKKDHGHVITKPAADVSQTDGPYETTSRAKNHNENKHLMASNPIATSTSSRSVTCRSLWLLYTIIALHFSSG